MNESLGHIFIDSLLINNFVLCVFLGMCPFLGLSSKFSTAWRMGVAVIFVITISSMAAYGTNQLLVAVHAEYRRLISFIVIIAATVQLTEMIIKKTSPALSRELGIYLLITTNCAVLAVALFQIVATQFGAEHRVRRLCQWRVLPGHRAAVAGAETDGTLRHSQPGARHGVDAGSGQHSLHGLYGLCGHGKWRLMMMETIWRWR